MLKFVLQSVLLFSAISIDSLIDSAFTMFNIPVMNNHTQKIHINMHNILISITSVLISRSPLLCLFDIDLVVPSQFTVGVVVALLVLGGGGNISLHLYVMNRPGYHQVESIVMSNHNYS